MTPNDSFLLAVAGLTAVIAALFSVPLARALAIRLRITDRPAKGKHHEHPVPYLGGIAVALCVVIATPIVGWTRHSTTILAAAVLLCLVGFIDDLRTLSPLPRLAAELAAAGVAVAAGVRFPLVHGAVGVIVTLAWIVILTNAYNLIDNMDGCAAAVVVATAAMTAVPAIIAGQLVVASFAIAIAGACAGFLAYNWHPAQIFLGDAGSLFLGFLLSVTVLQVRFSSNSVDSAAAVVLFALPVLFDTTLVVISRVRAGKPFYVGGTDHTSHRLFRAGLTHHLLPLVLGAGAISASTLGLLVAHRVLSVWVVAGLAALGVVVGLFVLLRLEAPQTTSATPEADLRPRSELLRLPETGGALPPAPAARLQFRDRERL